MSACRGAGNSWKYFANIAPWRGSVISVISKIFPTVPSSRIIATARRAWKVRIILELPRLKGVIHKRFGIKNIKRLNAFCRQTLRVARYLAWRQAFSLFNSNLLFSTLQKPGTSLTGKFGKPGFCSVERMTPVQALCIWVYEEINSVNKIVLPSYSAVSPGGANISFPKRNY